MLSMMGFLSLARIGLIFQLPKICVVNNSVSSAVISKPKLSRKSPVINIMCPSFQTLRGEHYHERCKPKGAETGRHRAISKTFYIPGTVSSFS
jgi:hypothetical protein